MKKHALPLLLACLLPLAAAAQTVTLQRTLNWAETPGQVVAPGGDTFEFWSFQGCGRSDRQPTLPVFAERFALNGPAELAAEVTAVEWESFNKKVNPTDDATLGADLQVRAETEQERTQWYGRVVFCPIRQVAPGRFERARSFTVQVRVLPRPDWPSTVGASAAAGGVSERGTTTSVLADGDIYKFGVSQSAVYKLDYTFLKNTLGISNLDQIDPRNLRLYGNGGAMLPERNSDARPDDLVENAIFVSGEGDGKFDAGDYILFYAVGPAPVIQRQVNNVYSLSIRQNLYDRNAWYFVKVSGSAGLRLTEQANVTNTVATTEQFDDVGRVEDEKYNLLDESDAHEGSGKRWFGDLFEQTRSREYSLSFPNVVAGQAASVGMVFAGRAGGTTSVRLTADGKAFTANINGVVESNNNSSFASGTTISGTFTPDDNTVQLKVEYLNSALSSRGWLDYIEVNARRNLTLSGDQMTFRDLSSRLNESTLFRLGGAGNGVTIWDVTTPQVPQRQAVALNGGTLEFGANTNGVVRTYVAFRDNGPFATPEATTGKIANQNVHGLEGLNMLIVYPKEFESAAQQLAQHRRDYSGFTVGTVLVHEVFNEFSSGAKDPGAIRDLARLLYERNPDKFEYLLLFGDGSFDPKNNSNGENNNDWIPAWETDESFSPIEAHPSDDFFGLLSPTEDGALKGALEIAVGRITARDPNEAQAIVDKIVAYDKSPLTLGDWHLRLLYVADDQETQHIAQAETLSANSEQRETFFNVNKVYFDAYQRVATSSEKRIPDAKAAINADIFKGNLVTNYIGHGGPKGWAQERVVDLTDIAGWENKDKQPLFVTATCSFGGYDDYSIQTGGEQILGKADGGGIALFTTVRPVYISSNDALTDAVQKFIFTPAPTLAGGYRTIGDILKDGKNSTSGGVEDNARRFTLLGDPALHLAMPEYEVRTDSVNGRAVLTGQATDTLSALERVSVAGSVTDHEGNLLSNFTGRVFVTLYDKPQDLTTLGLNGSSQRTFSVQRNTLFRGSATVTNGKFKLSFVVPKDINYSFGYGKLSYYAENGTPLDAAGGDLTSVVIGGTSTSISDNKPPTVQPFLNTDAFVFGGITDTDPKVLIQCTDDYGMNVSGTSIGHDLTAVLDGNVLETIVLNEFYQSAQDNPLKGQAIYPLRNLAVGRHTLQVKGWDVANNSGEGYTEFVVAEDGKAALDHVLNYPNPFTTNTAFQFEHNLAGQVMDVQISIFTIGGRLVKTLQNTTAPSGYRVTDLKWDGLDDYGDRLARGVYVYRVKVRGTDLAGQQVTAESKFERLVILR